jgi:hypothetical protein
VVGKRDKVIFDRVKIVLDIHPLAYIGILCPGKIKADRMIDEMVSVKQSFTTF